jgi:O-antigen/teichoic acid export membrane protein
MAFPVFVTLAVFAPLLMSLFGPQFRAGATALTILSLAMFVNIGTGAVGAVLSMGGKSSWVLLDNSIALLLNVVLNLALIPRFGMTGAAIAWAVAIVVGNLLPLVQVWRLWQLQPVTAEAVLILALTLGLFGGLGLIARALAGATPAALVSSVVLASSLYGAVLWKRRSHLRAGVLRDAVRIRPRVVQKPVAADR